MKNQTTRGHSQRGTHSKKTQIHEVQGLQPQEMDSTHTLELEIQNMLLQGTDEMFIADTLIRKWSANAYNEHQSHTICQFLIQCGFYASLCNQIAQRILKRQEVSLQDAAYILRKFDAHIDQESVDLLFQGLEESCKSEFLAFMSHDEDLLDRSIENNWGDHLKKIQTYLIDKWHSLSKDKTQTEDEEGHLETKESLEPQHTETSSEDSHRDSIDSTRSKTARHTSKKSFDSIH